MDINEGRTIMEKKDSSKKRAKDKKSQTKRQSKTSLRNQGITSFTRETRLGRSAGIFAPSRHHLRSIIDEFLEKLFDETGLEIGRDTMIKFVNDKAHMSKDTRDYLQKRYDKYVKETSEQWDYINKLKSEGKWPILERKID